MASDVVSTAFRSAYDLAFQISPIILVSGIAESTPGKLLPVIALTGQLAAFAQGAVTSGLSLDDFFARFVPIPGGTLLANAIGTYPFANQQVAANAIVQQPLNISLEMIVPVNKAGGYLTKLAILTSLRSSLNAHNNSGGLYHIATPAYIYTNCLMTGMTDITSGDTVQQQVKFQLDFVQPLVTQAQATTAQNSLMSNVTGGKVQVNSLWSSLTTASGNGSPTASGINGMAGAVNTFLSAPVL
jgi:hypothetical protein